MKDQNVIEPAQGSGKSLKRTVGLNEVLTDE